MADRHQAQAYPLRLSEELKERVAAAAKEAGRSLNAEIAARLQTSFEQDERMRVMLGALSQPDDQQRVVLDAIEQLRHEVSQLRTQLKRGK